MSDFRAYVDRDVLVQLDGDYTLTGRLNHRTKDGLVLVGAELHDGDRPTPMDGEVWVPAARILWVQVPPVGRG